MFFIRVVLPEPDQVTVANDASHRFARRRVLDGQLLRAPLGVFLGPHQARRQPRAVVLQELVLGVRRAFRLRLHIQRDDERTRDQLRVRGVHGRVRPSFDAFDTFERFIRRSFFLAKIVIVFVFELQVVFQVVFQVVYVRRVQIGGSVGVRRVRPDTPTAQRLQSQIQGPPVPAVAPPRPHRVVEQEARRVRGGVRRASRRRRERRRTLSRLVDFLGRECLLRVLPDRPVRDVVHDRSEREVDVQVIEPSGVRRVRVAPKQTPRRYGAFRRSEPLQRDGDGRASVLVLERRGLVARTVRTVRRADRLGKRGKRVEPSRGSTLDPVRIFRIFRIFRENRPRGCRGAERPERPERPELGEHGYFPRRRVVGHHARLALGALRAYSCGAHRRGGLAREHAPGGLEPVAERGGSIGIARRTGPRRRQRAAHVETTPRILEHRVQHRRRRAPRVGRRRVVASGDVEPAARPRGVRVRRSELGVVLGVCPGAVEKRSAPAARARRRIRRLEPQHAEVRQSRAGQRGGIAPAPRRVRGSHQAHAPTNFARPGRKTSSSGFVVRTGRRARRARTFFAVRRLGRLFSLQKIGRLGSLGVARRRSHARRAERDGPLEPLRRLLETALVRVY